MAAGHRAGASPFALALAWTLDATEAAPSPLAVAAGVLVFVSSTWPDLDHPYLKGRHSPKAFFGWVTRVFAHLGYLIRTEKDRHREDYHRGPSHCVEWQVLLGALVTVVTMWTVPPLGPWAWCLGLAVTVGGLTHVGVDAMTPSGVPVSALWNYVHHGEVWRRHSLRLVTTDSALEHLVWTPVLYGTTGALALGMAGLLGPVLGLLVGV